MSLPDFQKNIKYTLVSVQFRLSPEDGSVEVVGVCAVDAIQVTGTGQLGCELSPGHLQDLVGDVALYDFHKMLHFVPVELQLMELHRAARAFHQCCKT